MVRSSLFVAALLVAASPLAAQEEYTWTSDRPDGEAPLGVLGARTLGMGEFQVGYVFTQLNSQSTWVGQDSIPSGTVGAVYDVAPLALTQITHTAMAAYGVTEDLTLMGTAEFTLFRRDQSALAGRYRTRVEGPGDITATAIYDLYSVGPWLLNASIGAVIPTGKSRTYDVTPASGGAEVAQPYDMRTGSGSFALVPGISGQVQNDHGSLGAQFKARVNLGTGVTDFTYGDIYEANGWAAYKVNDVISVSAGIRWQIWGDVEGQDTALNGLPTDPGNDTAVAGQRADMPIGVNFIMPDGAVLAGQMFFLEAVYALHHDYEGLQLGLDWGINLGWKAAL